MQWMGIWNHQQPVTIALDDPCWQSAESLGHTNHTIMQWLRLHTHPKLLAHQCGAHIRCLNHFICSVYGHMEPSATRYHRPCWSRFWQSAESLGHCWATNHTIMQWLRLHTHQNMHAHQYRAHIGSLNHFICSGWAYGTISNPLPTPLLTQILTVGWKLGSIQSPIRLRSAICFRSVE